MVALLACVLCLLAPVSVQAQAAARAHTPGGEVNIKLPSLEQGEFFGLNGHQFLLGGLVVCVLGLLLRPMVATWACASCPSTAPWPRSRS